jgi:hypothetical protein
VSKAPERSVRGTSVPRDDAVGERLDGVDSSKVLVCWTIRLEIGLWGRICSGFGGASLKGRSVAVASKDMFEKYVAPTGPELTLSEIGAIAKAKVASVATQDPPAVSIVKGNLRDAIAILIPESTEGASPTAGQTAWLNSSVDAASMRGNFTLEVAKTPRGEGAPTGTNLTLIIDAHTGEVEGRFLASGAPELARLGTVAVLN